MKRRAKLDKILKDYIYAFEKKHGREFEFAVSDDLTGIISFGDIYYLDITNIIYDIDNDLPVNLIFEWLEYIVDNHANYDYSINLKSYAKGIRYSNLSDLNKTES